VLFPLGFAVYISFTDWPLIGSYHFIGGANYSRLAHDPVFLHSVLFTLLYTAIVTGPIFVVGYLQAMFVRSNRFGSVVFRTAFFLPYVVGLATESFMVLLEVQPDSGAVNFVLAKLGIARASTAWTVHEGLALGLICVLVVWFVSGLTMMLLMAGMQGIPEELYEAAEVDGATWWDSERRITLPLLRRYIALSLIISVIGSFLAFIQFHLGYATAGAVALVVVVGIISAAQFFLLRDDKGGR
jgi:multiple sugar transport system permease protein